MSVKNIPIGKVVVKSNVRRDDDEDIQGLMDSILEYDILQPILVKPEGKKYRLISGHRRFRAVKASGEIFIPALIWEDISDSQIPIIQLSENVQRKQMKAWELVEVFDEMKAQNARLTNRKIAKMLGKSEAWVYMKYKASKMAKKLLGEGMTLEELEELSENTLYQMNAALEDKKREKPNNRGRKTYTYPGGFEVVNMAGDRPRVMLMFRDESVIELVMEALKRIQEEREAVNG